MLRSWIEDGTLAPGEALKDDLIAQRLGVSRTPVREALLHLAYVGMVEMEPNRVTRVTQAAADDLPRVYRPLAALHAVAAAEAVERIDRAGIEALAAANRRLREAAERGDWEASWSADLAFHDVLVAAADNRYLRSALEPLQLHVRRIGTLYFAEMRPALESADEHELIIAAVEDRDVEAARRLVLQNMLRGVERAH